LGRVSEDANVPVNVATGFGFNRALLKAFQGKADEARDTLERVRPPAFEGGMLQMVTWFERTRAFVELLAGDGETAWEAAMAGVRPDPTGMNAPLSTWGGVLAGSWTKDAEKLRTALEAARRLTGQWIELVIATGEAALDAIEGRTEEAVGGFA